MRRSAPLADTRLVWVALLASACAGRSEDDTGRMASALRVCAAGETTSGIDVSRYQGQIDWDAVASSGVTFAMARVSDGTAHPDGTFAANWAGMRRAGLVRGAYQFFEPTEDPSAQAALVVDRVGRLGVGDLPAALDVETTGGASRGEIALAIRVWVDAVEAGTGKKPMVYTAAFFWNTDVHVEDYASYGLWVANYGLSCPDLPDPWTTWRFWQHGVGSGVAGVDAQVDLDTFNGSLHALEAFAGMPDGRDDGGPLADARVADARAAGATPVCIDAGVAKADAPPAGLAPVADVVGPADAASLAPVVGVVGPADAAPPELPPDAGDARAPATPGSVPAAGLAQRAPAVAFREASAAPAGCGCRAARGRSSSHPEVLLALAAVAARRRRGEPQPRLVVRPVEVAGAGAAPEEEGVRERG